MTEPVAISFKKQVDHGPEYDEAFEFFQFCIATGICPEYAEKMTEIEKVAAVDAYLSLNKRSQA